MDNVIDSVQVVDSLGFVVPPDPFATARIFGLHTELCRDDNKVDPRKQPVTFFLPTPPFTIRDLEHAIGKIVSSFPVVFYGPLYYRSLDRNKLTALHANRWNFDSKVK